MPRRCSAQRPSMPPGSPPSRWRFLVDENLPERLTSQLHVEGYAAEHVYEVGLRTRPDTEVYAYALSAGATLITQDHDVQRDASQFTVPHPGVGPSQILVR